MVMFAPHSSDHVSSYLQRDLDRTLHVLLAGTVVELLLVVRLLLVQLEAHGVQQDLVVLAPLLGGGDPHSFARERVVGVGHFSEKTSVTCLNDTLEILQFLALKSEVSLHVRLC